MKKTFFRSYESDASRLKGEVLDVVHPKSVNEVRDIVLRNRRIVIRGAGTGLSGGAVPRGDIVLDLSKMDKIFNFNSERKMVEVEAGVVLDDLQDFLEESGLEFPVKPSSHAVATIGGMISTDAVGSRGVKYGKTSAWVRWVEIVDDRGNVMRKGVTELSDYAGMEGITGVIVRCCLNLSEKRTRSASLIRLDSLDKVVELVRKLKMRRDVCSVEFFDKRVSRGIGFSPKRDESGESSEEGEGCYHVLIEFERGAKSLGLAGSGKREAGNNESEEWGGKLKGEAYDKVMVMRDAVYPFVAGEGYTRIEDPKIMIDRLPRLMGWLEERGIPVFGHIGSGILHPCFNTDQEKCIPEMMKLVARLGGQVSGEHGIGILKRKFVEMNDKKILLNVKKRCDPSGKFNVGKVV